MAPSSGDDWKNVRNADCSTARLYHANPAGSARNGWRGTGSMGTEWAMLAMRCSIAADARR